MGIVHDSGVPGLLPVPVRPDRRRQGAASRDPVAESWGFVTRFRMSGRRDGGYFAQDVWIVSGLRDGVICRHEQFLIEHAPMRKRACASRAAVDVPILWGRLTDEKLSAVLDDAKRADFSYSGLGMTRTNAPTGDRAEMRSVMLGADEDTWGRGVAGLRLWEAHRAAGAHVVPPDASILEGTTVLATLSVPGCTMVGPCRVVYVTDERTCSASHTALWRVIPRRVGIVPRPPSRRHSALRRRRDVTTGVSSHPPRRTGHTTSCSRE